MNVNSKYNSEEVNMMYSQKFIDNDDIYYNSIHLNKISLPKKIKIDPYLSSENHKINLSSLNATLPKNSLPLDWQKSFSLKKVEFIETLLPLIAYQNQQILVERERLFKIQNYLLDNKTLNQNDLEYLSAIADKYLIETNNKHKIDIVDKLLLSVNTILHLLCLRKPLLKVVGGLQDLLKNITRYLANIPTMKKRSYSF